MRLNHAMRSEIRQKASNFFRKAKENIKRPSHEECEEYLTDLLKPENVDDFFITKYFDDFRIDINDDLQFYLKVPKNKYATTEKTNTYGSPNISIKEPNEAIKKYTGAMNLVLKTEKEFMSALATALDNTTIEKAKTALPEMEQFL
jgi:hypothetical protein